MNTVSNLNHLRLAISWEEVTKIDTTVPLIQASVMAKKLGYQYFIRSRDVYDVNRCCRIGQIDELRIYLEVEEAPSEAGIFYDESTSKWYGILRNKNLHDLCRLSRKIDRILLSCPRENQPYALRRGATQSSDDQLFLPTWYWLSDQLKDTARRLCYWLPEDHPEFLKFRNEKLAAEWISLNAGYTPIDAYLPQEKSHLETLCKKGVMYVCQADVIYFRWNHWDNY